MFDDWFKLFYLSFFFFKKTSLKIIDRYAAINSIEFLMIISRNLALQDGLRPYWISGIKQDLKTFEESWKLPRRFWFKIFEILRFHKKDYQGLLDK